MLEEEEGSLQKKKILFFVFFFFLKSKNPGNLFSKILREQKNGGFQIVILEVLILFFDISLIDEIIF